MHASRRPRRRGVARPPTPCSSSWGRPSRLRRAKGATPCSRRLRRSSLRGRRTRSRSPRPARARWVPGRPRGRSRRTVGACNSARRGRAGDPREGHGVELSRSLRLSRRSLPGALELGEEALAMAEALEADEIRAEALLYVGGAKYKLDQPRARQTCARAWRSRSPSTPQRQITRSCNNLSIILRQDGHVQESIDVSNEGLAVAESTSACVRRESSSRGAPPVSAVRAGTMGRSSPSNCAGSTIGHGRPPPPCSVTRFASVRTHRPRRQLQLKP